MIATLDGSVLFGGSFDPIHSGHEYIIEQLHRVHGYDRIYLIPAKNNRIRHVQPIASFRHRVRMCRLVAHKCSAAHLIAHTHRYAQCQTIYDTLLLLKRHYTWSKRIHLAIGDDLVSELEHWHHFDTIKHQLTFVVFHRDSDTADIEQRLSQLNVSFRTVHNELQPMRSSSLRSLLETGQGATKYISQPIYTYIVRKRLYHVSIDRPQQIARLIKHRLQYEVSPRRRKHIRGVVRLIKQLNSTHNYDARQLELAALSHDWAREWPLAHLKAFVTHHRPLTELELETTILCHGFVASKLLQHTVKSTSQSASQPISQPLLQAIAHHTLGTDTVSNPILSMLYAADYLELGRKLFSKKQTKQLVKLPIHHVVAFVIEHSIQRGQQPSAITTAWYQSIVSTMYHD